MLFFFLFCFVSFLFFFICCFMARHDPHAFFSLSTLFLRGLSAIFDDCIFFIYIYLSQCQQVSGLFLWGGQLSCPLNTRWFTLWKNSDLWIRKGKREEEMILVAISVVLKFCYLQLFFFSCTSIFVWYVLSDRMDFIWFFKHPIAQTSGKLQYFVRAFFLFCNFSHDWLLHLRYYLWKQSKLISQKMILRRK